MKGSKGTSFMIEPCAIKNPAATKHERRGTVLSTPHANFRVFCCKRTVSRPAPASSKLHAHSAAGVLSLAHRHQPHCEGAAQRRVELGSPVRG